MKADIGSFSLPPQVDEMDDETAQKELDKILESSPEVEKILEVLVDPDFVEEDRQRVKDLILGKSEESAGDVLDAIRRGDILDEVEKILKKDKPSKQDIEKMRDLIAPTDDSALYVEPDVICKQLGPELMKRYFELLQGRSLDKPYFFPSEIQDHQMEDYLRFEMNRENLGDQAEYVEGFIKYAHSPHLTKADNHALDLATNLTISFLRAHPAKQIEIQTPIPNPDLKRFYNHLYQNASGRVVKIFEHLAISKLKVGK